MGTATIAIGLLWAPLWGIPNADATDSASGDLGGPGAPVDAPPLSAVSTAAPVAAPPNSAAPFGNAPDLGAAASVPSEHPIVGMTASPDGGGYWLAATDGGIFNYGDAPFLGSTGAVPLNSAIVGIAAPGSPHATAGPGYWMVAGDGGIFNFGTAPYLGSTGAMHLNAPVVGMAGTPDGAGYWLVTADGGIFNFGDAAFFGSTGGNPSAQPVVAMASTPSGHGYWLVAADGTVSNFGDAQPFPARAAGPPSAPVVGIAPTPDGGGYWLVSTDGSVASFGNAADHGSLPGEADTAPAVALVATRDGGGYWVVHSSSLAPLAQDALSFIATRGDTVTAAVLDLNSRRTYAYRPGFREHTASLVKVDIMATLFAEVAAANRSLTSNELNLLTPMIEQSDNAAASSLWREIGGGSAVASFNTNIGMPNTTPAGDGFWGKTLTTALDQIKMVQTFAFPNHVLREEFRGLGLSLMEHVTPSQAWGISGGVPPGVTVALKNGFAPMAGHGWQMNSMGWVHGQGHNYILVVMTQDNPSEAYGIATIEGLATRVWRNPAGG